MKMNNKGFSMVTVIFAIVIIAILVSSCFAFAHINADMKKTLSKSMQNFYSAETGMNDVKSCIEEICADKLKDSYETITLAIDSIPSDKLDLELKNVYITALNDYFTNTTMDASTMLTTYNRKGYPSGVTYLTINEDNSPDKKGYSVEFNQSNVYPNLSKGTITLSDITVHYNNGEFLDTITTDIVISSPKIFNGLTFDTALGSSYLDYSLIADKNIDIENVGIGINGSVYSGNDIIVGYNTPSSVVFKSEKLVARNNVVLFPLSTVSSYGKTFNDLGDWYVNNILTLKARQPYSVDESRQMSAVPSATTPYTALNLNDNIYVKGDTNLGSCYGNVNFMGTYYGFTNTEDVESTININASHINADLTGLTNLWLSGTNYINVPKLNGDSETVLTGESFTGKFTQSAYLVPSCCIYIEDESGNKTFLSNPIDSSYLNKYKVDISLNGKNHGLLLENYVDSAHPYKEVKVKFTSNGSTIQRVYLYLVMENEEKAAQYLRDLNFKYTNYLSDRAKSYGLGNISLANNCALKTIGNVITYDGYGVDIKLNNATKEDSFMAFKNDTISKKYTSLTNTLTENSTDLSNSVFDYIIDTQKITDASSKFNVNDSWFKANNVCYYNGKQSTEGELRTIEDTFGNNYRVLIVDGDVDIKKDFRGLIIATGDINIKTSHANVWGTLISKGNINFGIQNCGIDNDIEYLSPLSFLLNKYEYKDEINNYFTDIKLKEESTDFSLDIKSTITYKNWVRG